MSVSTVFNECCGVANMTGCPVAQNASHVSNGVLWLWCFVSLFLFCENNIVGCVCLCGLTNDVFVVVLVLVVLDIVYDVYACNVGKWF